MTAFDGDLSADEIGKVHSFYMSSLDWMSADMRAEYDRLVLMTEELKQEQGKKKGNGKGESEDNWGREGVLEKLLPTARVRASRTRIGAGQRAHSLKKQAFNVFCFQHIFS